MPRYVTKQRHKASKACDCDYWLEPSVNPSTIDIWESDPIDTGLLDSEGNQIYRTMDKIGFI